MGRTSAGIAIKTNTEIYTLDNVVECLFEKEFVKTLETGDIRSNNWIIVSKTKDFFHIQRGYYS